MEKLFRFKLDYCNVRGVTSRTNEYINNWCRVGLQKQGYSSEERIDFDETCEPVTRLEVI